MTKKARYEFAIKKDVLNSGQVIYTPVCRKKSKIGIFGMIQSPWERITKIYNKYTLTELDFNPELKYSECEEHIEAYKSILYDRTKHEVAIVEFDSLEEKEI